MVMDVRPQDDPSPGDGLRVLTPVDAHLTWRYDDRERSLSALYERGKQNQWNATTDLDWSIDVQFGRPLHEDSEFALAAFDGSHLASYRPGLWDTFRWEFQAWMVSQFLHGEQGALVAAARLVEVVPEIDAKCCAASQVGDEARHIEAFARYLREKVPTPYPISPSLRALVGDALADSRWDITVLGMQIMVEALAMAAFRLADKTFHDALIRDICRLVARDEARHVSFGILSLKTFYGEITTSERAERETFVLEAAHLMSRRFLMADVWERIGVDHDEGTSFARTNELMIRYRQTIFAKVVSSLGQIGLMTPRVRNGLAALDLLGIPAVRLANANVRA
jgi:hypothetical protein